MNRRPHGVGASRDRLADLDARDPLAPFRERFHLPEGVLYFDGNSLGPVPRATRERVAEVVERQWGEDLVASWNVHDWIDLPRRAGAKIAPLVGAAADEVIVCDSVSVNLFKLLRTGLALRPERRTILCQADHFPTDLYIAQGLADLVPGVRVRRVAIDDAVEILRAEGEDVAVTSFGHVDFKSGRLVDMAGLTAAAHEAGALSLFDLSHSAGALPVRLDECGVDLAVGCGYKFLNGGPGAPSFLYVARRHHEAPGFDDANPLPGWLGHRRPFDFSADYEPAPGVERYVCGTPPILALSALDAALDAWVGVDLELVREKSMRLGDLFLELADARLDGLGMRVACPRDAAERGSQVCLAHEEGYAVMQALIARGIVGDFRAPDILRFGLCPLYLRHVDVWDAVEGLREILTSGEYRDERFRRRGKVT